MPVQMRLGAVPGGIVGMLIFLYVESMVFLLGAELIRFLLEHNKSRPAQRRRSVRKVRS